MVLGSHVIFSAYGFWLPNDPRGSWSDFVRSWELARFGPATKVETRRSVAAAPHNWMKRQAAKSALQFPPVSFTGVQALTVANGFREFITKNSVVVWACSILPEHVHMVIGRHDYKVEQIVNLLKGRATIELKMQKNHPLAGYRDAQGRVPSPWAQREWKVFLDSIEDIVRAIEYVENNPLKEGKPRQKWSFVTPFQGLDV